MVGVGIPLEFAACYPYCSLQGSLLSPLLRQHFRDVSDWSSLVVDSRGASHISSPSFVSTMEDGGKKYCGITPKSTHLHHDWIVDSRYTPGDCWKLKSVTMKNVTLIFINGLRLRLRSESSKKGSPTSFYLWQQ